LDTLNLETPSRTTFGSLGRRAGQRFIEWNALARSDHQASRARLPPAAEASRKPRIASVAPPRSRNWHNSASSPPGGSAASLGQVIATCREHVNEPHRAVPADSCPGRTSTRRRSQGDHKALPALA